jgi:hypothetical protein
VKFTVHMSISVTYSPGTKYKLIQSTFTIRHSK